MNVEIEVCKISHARMEKNLYNIHTNHETDNEQYLSLFLSRNNLFLSPNIHTIMVTIPLAERSNVINLNNLNPFLSYVFVFHSQYPTL